VGVCALQAASPTVKIFIYVHQGVSPVQLQQHVHERFGIALLRPVEVVPLHHSDWVRPERYRHFTMIRQAVGAARLGWEALSMRVPEVRGWGRGFGGVGGWVGGWVGDGN